MAGTWTVLTITRSGNTNFSRKLTQKEAVKLLGHYENRWWIYDKPTNPWPAVAYKAAKEILEDWLKGKTLRSSKSHSQYHTVSGDDICSIQVWNEGENQDVYSEIPDDFYDMILNAGNQIIRKVNWDYERVTK